MAQKVSNSPQTSPTAPSVLEIENEVKPQAKPHPEAKIIEHVIDENIEGDDSIQRAIMLARQVNANQTTSQSKD